VLAFEGYVKNIQTTKQPKGNNIFIQLFCTSEPPENKININLEETTTNDIIKAIEEQAPFKIDNFLTLTQEYPLFSAYNTPSELLISLQCLNKFYLFIENGEALIFEKAFKNQGLKFEEYKMNTLDNKYTFTTTDITQNYEIGDEIQLINATATIIRTFKKFFNNLPWEIQVTTIIK